MRGKTYRILDTGVSQSQPFRVYANGGFLTSQKGNSSISTYLQDSSISCLVSEGNISIVNSGGTNYYRFNADSTYTSDLSYGLYTGTYTITNIPEAHPIAFLNTNKTSTVTYSPSANTSAPIIIKVSGGSTTADANGDYYTFTDNDNNTISIGNNSFRFMRGKTYRIQDVGVTQNQPFRIYANGGFLTSQKGNSSISTVIPQSVITCVTTSSALNLANGNNYRFNGETTYTSDLSYGFYIGTYTITGIPEAHPIAFLNSGKTSNITYMPVSIHRLPIIKVSGGSTSTNSYNDYYTFRDANDNLIYLGNGGFRFMRGKTYRFTDNGIMSNHPIKISLDGGSSYLQTDITGVTTLPGSSSGGYYGENNKCILYRVYDSVKSKFNIR